MPSATPAGVPVLMRSPGCSTMNCERYRMTCGDREDHVRRRAVLPQLAVDPQPQAERLRVGHLIRGHQPRAAAG